MFNKLHFTFIKVKYTHFQVFCKFKKYFLIDEFMALNWENIIINYYLLTIFS